MNKLIRPRKLWYEKKGEIFHLDEVALITRPEPLVILGEAGMGKTELTKLLKQRDGWAGCTARQLLRRGARPLLGNATTLVIDALDEVGSRGEGDTVDLVLSKLGEASFPHFVLTCRVADWRNATALLALTEDYPDREPLILHLDPLNDEDVVAILADRLNLSGDAAQARAREIIEHLHANNLDGLLGNPQTLELIARTSGDGKLPDTKSALFAEAVEILRREHRDDKISLQVDEATALSAAGASFAALILTGGEAVAREVAEPGEYELPWAEVAALQGAAALEKVIGSRLFEGSSAERFTYWHRSIGEYLGARWLATHCRNALGRQRLLQLFHADISVPASLRGLHAWLAHQGDHDLATAVIHQDPMGVIEYGDGDALGLEEARALLTALKILAMRDPSFRDWKRYSIKSIMQPALLQEVRKLITDPNSAFGLRTLLLEAIPGSQLANTLRTDLRHLLLAHNEEFIHRSRAAEALIGVSGEDWQALLEVLLEEASADGLRLALEIIASLKGLSVSNDLIVRIVIRRAENKTPINASFYYLARTLPDARLDDFLDAFVAALPKLGNRHERLNNDELTDLGYDLIARRLKSEQVEPLRLWRWLRPFDEAIGFSRNVRRTVHEQIRADDALRRAIQAHVLFDEPNDKTVWERTWRLTSRSPGFQFTNDDVLLLFKRLPLNDSEDDRWRDLVRLVPHSITEGEAVRERAKAFVANRPDMLAWIDRLAEPQVPEWKIKEATEKRRREAKRAMEWQRHRRSFDSHIREMRQGEFQQLLKPARAYLKRFQDVGEDLPAHERIAQWLGEELRQAAHEGFEAFLLSDKPPTAKQVADGHAESRPWYATDILVAGMAERWRQQTGAAFIGVSDDRLLSVYQELRHSKIADYAGLVGLEEAVAVEVKKRGLCELAARQWIEPQLVARRDHVDQLHSLMWDAKCSALASRLAQEWLAQFSDLAVEPEAELMDHLLRNCQFDTLRPLCVDRQKLNLATERRANWNAVAFIVDFANEHERLEEVIRADKNWLWTLRNRVGGDGRRSLAVRLTAAQLAWIFANFRILFPPAEYPANGWGGDTNPWDASDFLLTLASRLANDTSTGAVRELAQLRDAPVDGYTIALRSRVAEQSRKAVQERYQPVLLAGLKAIVDRRPPTSVADMQATMLALLMTAEARVKSSPDDAWRGFFNDQGEPRDEERCRDHPLTVLGLHPESIDLLPEGHLADDKRADIIALRPGLRLPIEIKGQWHDELWRAADSQLDRLYAADYAAERRGIYLVLWFGNAVEESKKPRGRSVGQRRPQSPEKLLHDLVAASDAARAGRIKVMVFDLSRPVA